jgi:uncharacterized membrane protein YsdA (DUF1294 family)/cold shock CspA family protein
MKSGLRNGQLIKWKDDREFGFIHPVDGSQDVFLHISEIKDSTRRPQIGDTIYYYVVAKNGKICASNAFILGARSKGKSSSLNQKSASNVSSSFPFIGMLAISILPLIGSIHFAWKTATILPPTNLLPLILYAGISRITFTLYAKDKYQAERGKWRTSEATLHLFELMGGWLGGFIAQQKLHHKSSKKSYQVEFWSIVIIHQIGWLTWLLFHKAIIR